MAKVIKVIDLIQKIANGEIPSKIKYDDKIYEYKKTNKGTGYLHITELDSYYWFASDNDFDDTTFLNDTVEILKEQQDIDIQELEELEIIGTLKSVSTKVSREENLKRIDETEVNNFYKINDIIKQQNKILQWAKQLDKNIKDKE